jgi:hypothetical protein
MIEADAPSTEEATLAHRVGARPTGDSHGRTTRGPAQRGEGLGHRGGVERRAGGWSSDPMIEVDAPSTGVLQVQIGMVCASHRG